MKDFIIPAIDLKEGKVVRLYKGDFEKSKVYSEKPEDMARFFEELGFRRLHVVDLEGSVEGKPVNLESIRKIRRSFTGTIQVGGGVRSLEVCRTLEYEGVDLFVVGTLAVKDSKAFERIVETYPKRVILAVDAKGGKVAVGGWKEDSSFSPEELARLYESLPLWGYLYTLIDKDGTLEGVDTRPYEEFKKHTSKPLLASGGVSSLDDVKKLMGVVEGVVVGRAIYEGRINLREL